MSPPPRAVGPFPCVSSGKSSPKGLQKKNEVGPLHPFLRVVCGQGSTSTRADRVCLSPPRRNERRCNAAGGRVQREAATPVPDQLLSRGTTVQVQHASRKRESTAGVGAFDGGVGRSHRDTGTLPAGNGLASSSEAISSLAGNGQGASEGATKETGSTTADRHSGAFPSVIAARDSSCSDKGKQGGKRSGVSEGDAYSGKKGGTATKVYL